MTFAITALILVLLGFILFGPRPRLDARPPTVAVPRPDDLRELADWLQQREAAVPGIIEGAEARIEFADPENPASTRFCFVYVHGFSATWPETAPVTSRLAARFDANVLQARLAGHGTEPETMVTPAEEWLASMMECWEIARQLGDRIVIVATSTGAPLSLWLASQSGVAQHIAALLFMSPNFGIRRRFAFLLTAPLSRYWIHWFAGRMREWEPANERQARYWSYRYSTLALIEMQKVVDWARQQDLSHFNVPLAVMYMKHDPTVDSASGIRFYERWGATSKALMPVAVDSDAPDHVFAGDIMAPQRTDWCVEQFAGFLESVR